MQTGADMRKRSKYKPRQQLDTCNIAELDNGVQLVFKTIRDRKARTIA